MIAHLDNNPSTHPTLQCGRFSLDLTTPKIMGILNVTPDSFSTVGRIQDVNQAVDYAIQMVEEGAHLIDIGGEPTNPSLNPIVPVEQEMERVVSVVEKLRKEVDVPISIDTSKAAMIEACIDAGADMINDVRALMLPGALEAVAKHKVAVCLMHMAYPFGVPPSVIESNDTTTLMQTIYDFLLARIQCCVNASIPLERIIIDPGIGAGNFGKSVAQNCYLLNHLEMLQPLKCPILIGVSRKTFIGKLCDLPVEERLSGSLAAAVISVSKGASIIRAHDVKATKQAVTIATAILKAR